MLINPAATKLNPNNTIRRSVLEILFMKRANLELRTPAALQVGVHWFVRLHLRVIASGMF